MKSFFRYYFYYDIDNSFSYKVLIKRISQKRWYISIFNQTFSQNSIIINFRQNQELKTYYFLDNHQTYSLAVFLSDEGRQKDSKKFLSFMQYSMQFIILFVNFLSDYQALCHYCLASFFLELLSFLNQKFRFLHINAERFKFFYIIISVVHCEEMEKKFLLPHPNSQKSSHIAKDRANGIIYSCALIKNKKGDLNKYSCSTVDLVTVYGNMDFLICREMPVSKRMFLQVWLEKQRYLTQVKIERVIPLGDLNDMRNQQKNLIHSMRNALLSEDFKIRRTGLSNAFLNDSDLLIQWRQHLQKDEFLEGEQIPKKRLYFQPYDKNNTYEDF